LGRVTPRGDKFKVKTNTRHEPLVSVVYVWKENKMKLWIVVRNNNYGPGYDFSYSDVYGTTTDETEAKKWLEKSTNLHQLTLHSVELGKTYKAG
jgi:hypothetical protein